MLSIKAVLKNNRPNLSDSSLKTYNSLLSNLYKKVYGDEDIDLEKFNNTGKFINELKDIDPVRRKTYLAALVVLTTNDDYQDVMMDDIQKSKQQIYSQEKNDKQKDSWIDTEEVMKIYEDLKTKASKLYRKRNKNIDDYQEIQNYVILSLLGGMFIPPRRLKDYVDFKIKDVDDTKDNFMDKKGFVFNSYKTQKSYRRQNITIPKELRMIMNKWIKSNPTEYLLYDTNHNQLNNVQLVQRLNKIFNNKISVNQLRHTYMTDKYSETSKTNKLMSDDFKMMGSSIAQEKVYIKTC
jgi:hypothetical protein